MTEHVYSEVFSDNPGGWYGWISNAGGPKSLEWNGGEITSRSPWWIDYNHAPPGAGYMHMVFTLATSGPQGEVYTEVGGPNRFIKNGFPTNFKGASLSTRCRGELVSRESQLVVLIQGNVDGITSGWLLTGSPLNVSEEWNEQTVTLAPDPALWTPLGVRHDRGDMYGIKPLEEVLSDVNVNIMLVLFPLDVAPMGAIDGDPHRLRPERDYPVWRHRLPEGYVTLDSVEISFPG
ncbi:MAG: hypothetical protein CMJ68_19700 [Planctomycetaceae bacterium]|nr:hypothetical protein [Planctomycetaceae bacterium]|tara:strand:+ start:6016 stop:6717 length:702 start_codon:yes stop_codon:yes gene_type:complete